MGRILRTGRAILQEQQLSFVRRAKIPSDLEGLVHELDIILARLDTALQQGRNALMVGKGVLSDILNVR
ncbi:hypothetical protein CSB45_07685 [candidate division KSB3 bacterium]|uniref:Uncharacterized protein n=1 Tax=candidate division KSB3 bacterium TaxID=2044937 RepID=A0A2G6E5M8_9BACT|nr:MAG: hypothetical protein CSB45_07685 [candidate division KSB3 bacterium]